MGDKKIKGKECKFSFHLPKIAGVRDDTHIIKETIIYNDGSYKKHLRAIKNYERPFYITKENYRQHKDKKETEDIKRVNKYMSTESDLLLNVARRLGGHYVNSRNLRMVKDSPYVYLLDVDSRAFIKNDYLTQYPDMVTPYDVCGFDIEVDTETNELIIVSIATNDKIYTVITKKFLNKNLTSEKNIDVLNKKYSEKLKYLYDKYIPESKIKERVKSVEYKIVNDEYAAVLDVFKKLHEWKPDIVAVWNIKYDIGHVLRILENNNMDPKYVFSEPSLPDNYKDFKYKKGQESKQTASGKHKPIDIHEQWHQILSPAYFYWIDAMSAYNYIRVNTKKIPTGYGLDSVTRFELGDNLGKLKFKDEYSEMLKGLEWHTYMVEKRPLEYIIYNQWDVEVMIELDNKTGDLNSVLGMLSGVSSFDVFNSGPKRIVNAMTFFYLEKGKVMGTKPNKIDDKPLLGLDGWISMIPSYRVKHSLGRPIYKGSTILTNTRMFDADNDQTSGYPNDGIVSNISKDTARCEIKKIGDIDVDTFKLQNIDLLFGPVNSLEYCNVMFNLPTAYEIKEKIKEMGIDTRG